MGSAVEAVLGVSAAGAVASADGVGGAGWGAEGCVPRASATTAYRSPLTASASGGQQSRAPGGGGLFENGPPLRRYGVWIQREFLVEFLRVGRVGPVESSHGDKLIVRAIEEVLDQTGIRAFRHPQWHQEFPWLVQGTTDAHGDSDLRLFGSPRPTDALARWEALRRSIGFTRVCHARQVHGARVLEHSIGRPAGVLVAEDADGHATADADVLLTVSVADCVPVFLVDPIERVVGVVHAGWRGAAAGVLEAGLHAVRDLAGSGPERLRIHMGPSICGRCYEVGPEVHRALGLPEPDAPTPVDLSEVLARRAVRAGVSRPHVTRSLHCTRCSQGAFYSHRGGDVGRQIGFIGVQGS